VRIARTCCLSRVFQGRGPAPKSAGFFFGVGGRMRSASDGKRFDWLAAWRGYLGRKAGERPWIVLCSFAQGDVGGGGTRGAIAQALLAASTTPGLGPSAW